MRGTKERKFKVYHCTSTVILKGASYLYRFGLQYGYGQNRGSSDKGG